MNVFDLAKTYGEYVRAGSKDGGEYAGPCPGCGGNDRFRIWPDQNNGEGSYWCRQCGKGGDILQFLMDFDGRSYHQACEILDKTPDTYRQPVTPMPAPAKKPVKKWDPEAPAAPADLWQDKALKFVDHCHQALLDNDDQMTYLAGRGIDPETVISARLGWNSENRYRPRPAWGLDPVVKDGKEKKLWLPSGLVIPVFDAFCDTPDTLTRVKIRRTDAARQAFLPELKYYAVPGSAKTPMVLGPDRSAFVVIEAELDALLVFQDAGDLAGVVALGSKSIRPDAQTADMLSTALVILDALDYDGTTANDSAAWKQNFSRTTRWPVPVGKDPGDAAAEGVDIRAWILAGLPPRFHIGQSRKLSADAGESRAEEAEKNRLKAEDGRLKEEVEMPDGNPLARLADAMKHTPLAVVNLADRLFMRSKNKSWEDRNWSTFGRVSDVLFLDGEVRSAVRDLPFGEYDYYKLEAQSATLKGEG